jgi:hypothetical protein
MGAEKIRNRSDYDDFYMVSVQEATKQIEEAMYYLSVIETFIRSRLA